MHRKALGVFALVAIVLAVFGAPAGAARDGSSRNDRRISISGGVVVASGDVVNGPVVSVDGPVTINGTVHDDVFVGDGRLIIRGQVTGNVLVVHGDVLITGRVSHDVVALDGRITTRAGARVGGDVMSRKAPNVAPGTVGGRVRKLNIKNLFTGFLIIFLIYLWVAVTVSVALLGFLFVLLFPRAADATAAAGRRFWPTVGWGALVGIAGPILGLLVLVTIVGIPFGLGMLSALNVLAPLGYVATSLIFGRLMVRGASTGARIGAFFAGFGILRAVALLPGIGVIVWVLVCMYGLGALAQAAWRAGRHTPEVPPSNAPPEPRSSAPDAAPVEQPPTLTENRAPDATGATAPAESSAGEAPPMRAPD
jgi:cytoskeletal protein CcmA (bactofilin family)